jgi:hypothetical protein
VRNHLAQITRIPSADHLALTAPNPRVLPHLLGVRSSRSHLPYSANAVTGQLKPKDLYDGVTALADVLWAAKERYAAAALISAMAAGSTGNEIFGLLRLELGTLRRSEVCRRLNLGPDIDALLAPLDAWYGSDTVLHDET